MLAVPPGLLDLLHLSAGTQVGLAVENGRLIVQPRPRKRYKLDDLIAQCDDSAPAAPDDHAWVTQGPVGEELL